MNERHCVIGNGIYYSVYEEAFSSSLGVAELSGRKSLLSSSTVVCALDRAITAWLIMWGLQQAFCFPSFNPSVKFLLILLDKCFQFLSFILIKSST